eukprot:TRINITY_DN2425_c0_g2_i3.p1 TRINITY_DN2425_c0_g2~~TRINITY_DN2425_c0_g2_i3.p1  ORF type:complete len:3502 (-),score=1233.34 TRINITY_DN2425_c0_g2_i3:1297-11802(-)
MSTDRIIGKKETAEKVPFRLSGSARVWVPIELSLAIQSLWNDVSEEPMGAFNEELHRIKTFSTFLKIICQTKPLDSRAHSPNGLTAQSRLYLMALALAKLKKSLRGNNIHAAIQGLEDKFEIIRNYHQASTELRSIQIKDNYLGFDEILQKALSPDSQSSAILGPDFCSFAVFGGQGVPWVQELRNLYLLYPEIRSVLRSAITIFHDQVRRLSSLSLYSQGMDVMSWIQEEDEHRIPNGEYLSNAHLSYPMIGLTQLLHYLVSVQIWGKSPQEILKSFGAASGHSQGIISAVMFASSKTEKELIDNIYLTVTLLTCLGVRIAELSRCPRLPRSDVIAESKQLGHPKMSPMLAVHHLNVDVVRKYVEAINKLTSLSKESDRQIEIGLINGRRSVVVVGHPESLHNLVTLLHKMEVSTAKGVDQTKIPYSKRKKEFSVGFLGVSAPFHSQSFLGDLVPRILQDCVDAKIEISAKSLLIPVYSTLDGANLQNFQGNFVEFLIQLQCIHPVDWVKSLSPISQGKFSHVIDFGPGQSAGIGSLCARNLVGAGIQVVVAGLLTSPKPDLCPEWALFEKDPTIVPRARNWSIEFGPKVEIDAEGKSIVQTKFTRVFGRPPLMMAGMTPTTVSPRIVAACYNAGYHGELAGGGLPDEDSFLRTMDTLVEEMLPGCGITINLLYLNQRLWGFQFPMIERLRREGYPIEGITIAAGVPSVEKSQEILGICQDIGLTHVSFKPGSVRDIELVCQIAHLHPDMNIVLQWTGGRGGGHHSFEDFHEPVLKTYEKIRKQSNIVLVAGSGFGDAEHSAPYLTGTWARAYGYSDMPFDAILISSRVMVAKEAKTSLEAKRLLVDTKGVTSEAEWEKSYDGEAGGVITVSSELGEPIHKIATRGLLLWRELDKEVFSLPPPKMIQKIQEKKAYIIDRLNADFQKVYFGKKRDGRVVDLSEMTYSEVLHRMVEIMYLPSTAANGSARQVRWIHKDYMKRVHLFAKRTEERFIITNQRQIQSIVLPPIRSDLSSVLPSKDMLAEDPMAFITGVISVYPQCDNQLLCSEDVDFFVQLCRERGQKPVNFVPVIDKDLSFWFKKDSLWQSEDLDAVQDQDVGRIVILQGPLAVRYSSKVDEPLKDIMNGIHQGWIDILQTDTSPVTKLTSSKPQVPQAIKTWTSQDKETQVEHLKVQGEVDAQEFFAWLTHDCDFMKAVLTSSHIIRDKRFASNLVRSLFVPRIEQSMEVHRKSNQVMKIKVFDSSVNVNHPTVIIERQDDMKKFQVTLYHFRPSHDGQEKHAVPLTFYFEYCPHQPYAPVHELTAGRIHRLKTFYGALWNQEESGLGNAQVFDYFEHNYVPTKSEIASFNRAINSVTTLSQAPLDFAIVACWESLIRPLFLSQVEGDLLDLVHLSNSYTRLDANESPMFEEGKQVNSRIRLTELAHVESGLRVTVEGEISRKSGEISLKPIVVIKSQFLFRDHSADRSYLRRIAEHRMIQVDKQETKEMLVSKEWINLNRQVDIGETLVFDYDVVEKTIGHGLISVQVEGKIFAKGISENSQIGTVQFHSENVKGNKVTQFFARHSFPMEKAIFFENGGYHISRNLETVQVPSENDTYALASKDLNPIHTNLYFSIWAHLPTTITHGMWTSAYARSVVEKIAANGDPSRILKFQVEFVGMVSPKDVLSAAVKHIGMKNGRKIVSVQVENQRNQTVLKGTAEIIVPNTAFVFTGQGSAEIGMGMDLYAKGGISKKIWDIADRYFLDHYGFSILEIVRKNPKSTTILFGGRKGGAIRTNYMKLVQRVQVKNGDVLSTEERPLFPEISERSHEFVFKHNEGLLFATQFSQPALVLMELASFLDMKEQGLIPEDCIFAGHSLGEYAALASVASVISTEALVDIVFLRGMTMQSAVIRDSQGRSPYAMVAVSPIRIHPTRFGQTGLHRLIDAISHESKELLQVVNFNIDNYQYVVAGERSNLHAMDTVLNKIKADLNLLKGDMTPVIKAALVTAEESRSSDGVILLDRGIATIPLSGIDVPFHSRFLKGGVPAFRSLLEIRMKAKDLNPKALIGKYIPNVTASPFSLSKAYVELVQKETGSDILLQVLQDFDTFQSKPQELGFKLLVELLAYQFASPVRWIETQRLLFTDFNIERMIEVGPAPTLSQMAKRTLEMGQYPIVTRDILWYVRDRSAIYYEINDPPVEVEDVKDVKAVKKVEAQVVASLPQPAAVFSEVPAASVPDEPVQALDSLRSLLAFKLKKDFHSVSPQSSIKEMVGGKSAVQNEILGEIAKEFGAEPDGAAEMDVQTLSSKIGSGYLKMGSVMQALTSKLISSKMPGGYGISKVKKTLQDRYGLGSGRVEAVLAYAVTMEPKARLASDGEADQWLDGVVKKYGELKGLTLGGEGKKASGGGTVTMDPEVLKKFNDRQEMLARKQVEVFHQFLGDDPLNSSTLLQTQLSDVIAQAKADQETWIGEMGQEFQDGIQSIFNSKKERRFDSSWNWIRQDLAFLYFDYCCGRAPNWNNDIRERLYHIKNRVNPEVVKLVHFYVQKAEKDGLPEITKFIRILANTLEAEMEELPKYRELKIPTAPTVQVEPNGSIHYSEEPRSGCRDMLEYVLAMEKPVQVTSQKSQEVQDLLAKLSTLNLNPEILQQVEKSVGVPARVPHLYIGSSGSSDSSGMDSNLTQQYFEVLKSIAREGVTFQGKTVLITGCGKDSIGLEIMKGMLRGGAKVYATTSRFSKEGSNMYGTLFDNHGAKFSELIVLPFNGGSVRDVNLLIDYIYEKEKSDLDYVIPFAAISENGNDIGSIDSKSELAHRIMMTNVIRLIGAIKEKKKEKAILTRPAHVLLPLSPNHGVFGHDGLYAESKLGLEALLNKWKSEGWDEYLSIVGAIIGWTRGTALMSANNIVSAGIEDSGVRTFTVQEMCFNLIALLHPTIVSLAQTQPLSVELNGGWQTVNDFEKLLTQIRSSLFQKANLKKIVEFDAAIDRRIENQGSDVDRKSEEIPVTPRANVSVTFPDLPSQSTRENLKKLRGSMDLSKIVVVTGFGEFGPYGNARTRWDIESFGEFSLEGCLEMAWMMGLIKYDSESCQWVDVQSKQPVKSWEFKLKYEETILKHTGIRLVEPELVDGYDPQNKNFMHQVVLTHDMEAIESSKEVATSMKQKHGKDVDIFQENSNWFFKLKKGAILYVPKALKFDRFVAGQIPSSWNPAVMGIPEDIIKNVDRVTLFTLVATVEALISSGITDPYEFYEYVHLSQVGNCIGGGFGGMEAIRATYRHRFMDLPVPSDKLQDQFINTVPAWINMLLLSSCGPIKTPVGACATSVESVEIGVDTIVTGKAKIVVVGGYDDFGEEGSYEFGQMKATSNTADEVAAGREPAEQSRPATSTRGGFMESHGAGVQILMSAELAIEMGVPIYGVVALTSTATDKQGRSVPAPGKGILSTARENSSKFPNPLLDFSYRKSQIDSEMENLQKWKELEILKLRDRVASLQLENEKEEEAALKQYSEFLETEFSRKKIDHLEYLGK